MRLSHVVLMAAAIVVLGACGGGGGGGGSTTSTTSSSSGSSSSTPSCGSATNTSCLTVNAGPTGMFANVIMTSVTICTPGTSTCQTIPNIQVDTGSTGLRILQSLITVSLPTVTDVGGNEYAECTGFADGNVWGTLAVADVKLSGELASQMSVQVIQDGNSGPSPPAACNMLEDTLSSLGVNGIIGIGNFLQDCGSGCATAVPSPALYYGCPNGMNCVGEEIPVASQVSNPVAFFAGDNNGVIVELPAIASTGTVTTSGTLVYGIGTRSNNGFGNANVLALPDNGANAGFFTASSNGTNYSGAFFDTGSSALFFSDNAIATCSGQASGYYCTDHGSGLGLESFSATVSDIDNDSYTISYQVADATYLFNNYSSNNNFNDLAAPSSGSLADDFDFGAPTFFGRSIYVGFEQRSASGIMGPSTAFTN